MVIMHKSSKQTSADVTSGALSCCCTADEKSPGFLEIDD
jgi:hypothetical protein